MNLTDKHVLDLAKILISSNSASEFKIKQTIDENKDLFNFFKFEYNLEETLYSLIRWASAIMILETNCQSFTKNGVIKYADNYGPMLLNKKILYNPNQLLNWLTDSISFNDNLELVPGENISNIIKINESFCSEINRHLELVENLTLDDYYKIWQIMSFLYYSIFVNTDVLKIMLLKLPGAMVDWIYSMQNNIQFKLSDNIGNNIADIQNNFNNIGFKTKYYEHNRVSTNIFGININTLFIQTNKINPRMYYHKPFNDINGEKHCCTRVNALYNFYLFGSINRNKNQVIINQSNNMTVNRKVNIS